MPLVKIDYDMIGEIVRLKEVVKGSVNRTMDGSLTAAHLASDVHALLDLLDMLENQWKGAEPIEEEVQAEAPQPEQQAPEGQQQ